MATPTSVARLVVRFDQEGYFLKAATAKAHLIRRAYIDLYFSALGRVLDYSGAGPLVSRGVAGSAIFEHQKSFYNRRRTEIGGDRSHV